MYAITSSQKLNLHDIINKYRVLIQSSEFNDDIKLLINNYVSITQACAYIDLKSTLEAIEARISLLSPDTQKQEFQRIVRERMQHVDETFLSPWLNPSTPGNDFVWELFQSLFSDGTFFDYIKLIAPSVDKIGIIEEELVKVDDKKQVVAVFKELPLTKNNVETYLKRKECIVVDNVIYPINHFTRHTDAFINTPIEVSRRNQLYASMLAILDSEKYSKLKQFLFRHPDIECLYTKICELKDKGQTLRDAIHRLKRALTLAGIKHTGQTDDDDAPVTASLAVTEFHSFIARFPTPEAVLTSVVVNNEIGNLSDFLKRLHENTNQCVEQAAEWLDNCLRNKNNEPWFTQSPVFKDEDIRQLKNDIHFFWRNHPFIWSLAKTSNLPLNYLTVILENVTIEDKNAVILNILMHVSSVEAYEYLLTHPNITKFINNNLDFVLIHLSDTQLNYFFIALTKNLSALSRCLPNSEFSNTVDELASEQRTIIVESLRERLPALLQSQVDSPLATQGIKFEIANNVQAIISQINHRRDTTDLITCFDRIFDCLFYCFSKKSRIIKISEDLQPNLANLIKNRDDLRNVLRVLNPWQIFALLTALQLDLSELIKTVEQLRTILQALDADQIPIFLMFFRRPLFIRTFEDFILLLQFLAPKQAHVTFKDLTEHLTEVFRSTSVRKELLNPIHEDEFEHHFDEILRTARLIFPRHISSAKEINSLLLEVQAELIPIICGIIPTQLNQQIQTEKQLGTALKYLSSDQISAFLTVLQARLPELIKTIEDVWCIIDFLESDDTVNAFIKAIEFYLPTIVNSMSKFDQFVKMAESKLDPDDEDIFRIIIGIGFPKFATHAENIGRILTIIPAKYVSFTCQTITLELQAHINTAEQLRTALSVLTPENIPPFLLVLKPRLSSIIKTFEDFIYVVHLPDILNMQAVFAAVNERLIEIFNSISEIRELLNSTPRDKFESRFIEFQRFVKKTFSDCDYLTNTEKIAGLLTRIRPQNIPLICSIIPTQLQVHVQTPVQLSIVLQQLDPEQSKTFLKVVVHLILQQFNLSPIAFQLRYLDPEKEGKHFYEFIKKEVLPHCGYVLFELRELFCALTAVQIIEVCQLIILSLARLIIDNDALNYLLMSLDNAQGFVFIQTFFRPALHHDSGRWSLINEVIAFATADETEACPLLEEYFDELKLKCCKVELNKTNYPFFTPAENTLDNLTQLLNHQHNNPVEKLLDINLFALENPALFEKIQSYSSGGKKRNLEDNSEVEKQNNFKIRNTRVRLQ